MITSLFYAVRQGFVQLVRNRAMAMASMFSITAMLLILGLFFIVAVNISVAGEAAKRDFSQIQVFLPDNTPRERYMAIREELGRVSGVAGTEFVDKATALANWKIKWGESGYLLDTLSSNPLPDSIIVTVSDLSAADNLVEKARAMEGVESVTYYKDTVDKLMEITGIIQVAALIIMVFLIVVAVVVVSNTIKLTVFARAKEISMMKYVGATNWFIRGPFFVEGILIGIVSAIISAGAAAFSYSRVMVAVGQDISVIVGIPLVPVEFMSGNLLAIFLAVGVSVGACGSIISMRRFLDT